MKDVNEWNDLFEGGADYEFAGRLDAIYALGKALIKLYYDLELIDGPKKIVVAGDSTGRLVVYKDGLDIRPFLKDEE